MATDQKVELQIGLTDKKKGGEFGPKFNNEDLVELGLDEDVMHVKLEFNHDRTISHAMCLCYLSIHFLSVLFIWCFPCFRYAISTSMHSRKAAVTERQLVLKQGAYGCFCCCWNEKTKSVSLEKITDLSVSQGCLERCFDIKSLSVENASSSAGAPEMILSGLVDPEGTRKLVLRTRDNNGFGASSANVMPNNKNFAGNDYNPLLNNNNNNQTQQVLIQQAQTLTDVKDLLVGIKQSLDTLNKTMASKNNNNQPLTNY